MIAETRGAWRSGLYATRSMITPRRATPDHGEEKCGYEWEVQEGGRNKAEERADHEQIAMSEVDHGEDAVNHGVTQSNKRVNTAQL